MRVACIGECMIEFRELPDGLFTRGYGGDTLNTAVYLARLGVPVDYVTALGDDSWSEEMLAGWRGEGVGTDRVLRIPGRLPGLYVIQTDARGERRFSYWRDTAPARELFDRPETGALAEALLGYDLLYLSGISLSLYGPVGRARLHEALERARAHGVRIAFDTNFRPRGWPDPATAQAAFAAALASADFVLASTEDMRLLFGADRPPALMAHAGRAEIVLKLAEPACAVPAGRPEERIVRAGPVADVVDTTAAGDSFAAAYLAARLRGAAPAAAAAAGHRLAGAVVRHRGAIIPREAMPSDLTAPSPD
ncbi:sugar kinase [Benzoatithermus flavus]|uniref:Sugar kinase n=1 Tax=Benzoatithermus flavus TaxID=3108223 RepID=A0ABU8XXY8_9PROT